MAVLLTCHGGSLQYNKWILAYANFPYPVALTLWHMLFCSTLAIAIVKLGYVQPIGMSADTYLK